jgi:hypothetical protein
MLTTAGRDGISAAKIRDESAKLHQRTGRTAGNGSLMRTAPVALAYLNNEDALVQAARMISELTHFDPEAGDACVLWCCAIRHAVLTGELDIRIGLRHIESSRRDVWSTRLDAAESSHPADFANNGWVVAALQAAWSAIATTPVPVDSPASGVLSADHLRLALDAAVRAGDDTDTVAAIAGGLLGATYGASAVPAEWRRKLHGWPDLRARGLINLASAITRGGKPDPFDFSYHNIPDSYPLTRHPHDDGVWLAGIRALRSLPEDVDVVVSLCRVGDQDLPADAELVEVRLIDQVGENANLDFVLLDTVRTVEQSRRDDKIVLIHCVQAVSRTPTIGALYGARRRGINIDDALRDVAAVLPNAQPNPEFRDALRRVHPDARS